MPDLNEIRSRRKARHDPGVGAQTAIVVLGDEGIRITGTVQCNEAVSAAGSFNDIAAGIRGSVESTYPARFLQKSRRLQPDHSP